MLRINKYNTCILNQKNLTFTTWHTPHPYNVNIFEKTCFACIDTVTKSCLKMTAWDTVETGRSVSLLLTPEQYIFISNLWVPAETTETNYKPIQTCEFQPRLQKLYRYPQRTLVVVVRLNTIRGKEGKRKRNPYNQTTSNLQWSFTNDTAEPYIVHRSLI